MEIFTKMCRCSTFLAAIGLVAFFGCGKVDLVDNLKVNQESFTRASSLTVTGQIINPETSIPVSGAIVKTNSFTATTDNNGQFSATLDNFSDSESVKVTKEGHINYEFAVDYTGIADNATLSWNIYLPEREECVWIGPNEGAWYKVTANNTEYVIDFRRGAVDDWTQVCVSQGGLAFGQGIPNAFGLLGINIDTPGNPEGVIFNSPADVRFDLAALLLNYPATPEATIINAAQDAAVGGANTSELSNLLYGINFDAASGGDSNNEGPLVISGFIPGNVIPGIGVTINSAFYFYQTFVDLSTVNNGQTGTVEDGVIVGINGLDGGTILDDNSTEVQDIPHQSVGDGGG